MIDGPIYPGVTPDSVKEKLLPIAKRIAATIGRETRNRNLIVNEELLDVIGLSVLGALSCGAHAALKERETLLADKEVHLWLQTTN